MTTRSLSDWVGEVMGRGPSVRECARAGALLRPMGALGVLLQCPLSAQAQMPGRPSGAGKQKERPKNEGGTGVRTPGDRAAIAANRHCQKPSTTAHPRSRRMVNCALTPGAVGSVVVARRESGKWVERAFRSRCSSPTPGRRRPIGSHLLTYFDAMKPLRSRMRLLMLPSTARCVACLWALPTRAPARPS
jgi:hypothetical protein